MSAILFHLTIRSFLLAVAGLSPLFSFGEARAESISATVSQSGFSGLNDGPPVPLTSGAGYDFAGTNYASLKTIDSLSVTLTFFDLDTATPGSFDFNDLTLGLDGIDTGTFLNGFPGSLRVTLTITDLSPDNTAAILTALLSDGRLEGSVIDADTGDNGIHAPSSFSTTLLLRGQTEGVAPIPEPATLLLLGTGLAGLGGVIKRRHARQH